MTSMYLRCICRINCFCRYCRSPTGSHHQTGFTLVEMLVAMAVIAILATVLMPSFSDYLAGVRVKRAAESIHGLILQARAEGPVRDQNLALAINADRWCLGFSPTPSCDCTAASGANSCAIDVAGASVRQVLYGDDFPGVAIKHNFPGGGFRFNRLRRTASPAGTIEVISDKKSLQIRVGVSGRVRICHPHGTSKGGYPKC